MRDLLPDLLHDRLPSGERDDVRAHVEACDACRSELDLLRRVRAAVPELRMDAARIAAVLPSYRARPWWRRPMESTSLRIAAAIVLLAAGAAIVSTIVRGPTRNEPVAAGPQKQSPSPVAITPEIAPPTGGTAAVSRVAPAGLATGETLQDLSDADLRALLDELGDLDAVTPAEDDVVPPSLGRGGP